MARRRGVSSTRCSCSGPARLTQAFGVTRARTAWTSWPATTCGSRPVGGPRTAPFELDPRIGIRRAADVPWRFGCTAALRLAQRGAARDPPATIRRSWPRTDAREQFEYLTRNAAEVVPEAELLDKLERSVASGTPFRVKLGLDPTAPDVTLGWAVVLRKLREFQDLGHTPVLIVGDFTAQVGDPSGKSETRPRLEADVVRAHADRLLGQFWRILDEDRTEVRYNADGSDRWAWRTSSG